jgi:YggT family protein
MFVVGNLFSSLASVISIILIALQWLIIIRVLLSWVNPDPNNSIVQLIFKFTEPILYPIRKILPFSMKFGLDISPFVAMLIIFFIQKFLVVSLQEWALRIKMG